MAEVKLIKSEQGLLKVRGEITHDSVDALVDAELSSENPVLQIDFSEVTRSDSSGLALMLHWMRNAKKQQFQLQFSNIPENLMALAKMCNLDDVLPLV